MNILTSSPSKAGLRCSPDDDREFVSVYWDGATPASLEAGDVVVVKPDADHGLIPIAPATLAVGQEIGGVHRTLSAAGYAWVQVRGEDSDAKVDGTAAVTKDHYLKCVNGAVNLIEDGAARSVNSVALARVDYAVAAVAAKSVRWLGHLAQVP